MDHERLLARISAEEKQIIDLCSDLVKVPSENPPGDTTRIVEFVSNYLAKRGLSCDIYSPKANMPNIVARIAGRRKGKRLVLNGHLDSYPAGPRDRWSRDPFSGDVEDGKIYGRGVSDMKAGVTASIVTFLYMAELRDKIAGELVLTLVSDEETGSWGGIRWLLDHVPEVSGDAVLNGEPTGGDLMTCAERGMIWLSVVARGAAAHGAYQHLGGNAIMKMCGFLEEIQTLKTLEPKPTEIAQIIEQSRDLTDARKGAGAADIIKSLRVNVGTISGGIMVNIVPDECHADVDIRVPQGLDTTTVLAEVERIRARYPGVEYEFMQRVEPSYTSVNEEIVKLTLKNAEAVRGYPVPPSSGVGGDDCRVFRAKGIPSALYGPQCFNMGAGDEYIYVKDLLDTVKVHVLTAFDYLQ